MALFKRIMAFLKEDMMNVVKEKEVFFLCETHHGRMTLNKRPTI